MGYVYINLNRYIYFGIYTMGYILWVNHQNSSSPMVLLAPHLQWFTVGGDQFLHGHCICLTLWKIMTTEAKPHREVPNGANFIQFCPQNSSFLVHPVFFEMSWGSGGSPKDLHHPGRKSAFTPVSNRWLVMLVRTCEDCPHQ
jgi:hypothetical protein